MIRQIKRLLVRIIVRTSQLLPLKRIVIFESYLGKRVDLNIVKLLEIDFGCPKYFVYQDMMQIDKEQLHGAICVRKSSLKYFILMAQATLIITNSRLHQSVRNKKNGQKIIQVWHGIPWKKLVHDQPQISFHHQTKEAYLNAFRSDVAKWDYLWVPSVEAEAKLKRAFQYQGACIRSMYPADQMLLSKSKHSARYLAWKQQYDMVVLYMPTFREHLSSSNKRGYADYQSIDLERLAQSYPNILFLTRSHYLIQERKIQQSTNVIDVNCEADLNQLYMDADILLTDYSSAIYPFSLLHKPIVSIQVDKEVYESLRGLYSDATCGMNITYIESIEEFEQIGWDNLPYSQVNQTYYDCTYQTDILSIMEGA